MSPVRLSTFDGKPLGSSQLAAVRKWILKNIISPSIHSWLLKEVFFPSVQSWIFRSLILSIFQFWDMRKIILFMQCIYTTWLDSSPDLKKAQKAFLSAYPQYKLTSMLDEIRKREFSRLHRSGDVYADYMGGALSPESLVKWHSQLLNSSILGNTHSINPSSALTAGYAYEARSTILSFFDATDDYTVIFTPNTTGALKVVGEAYSFTAGSHLVLAADSHNSVNGIRQFAIKDGATVTYLEAGKHGGFNENDAKALLYKYRRKRGQPASLLVLTGQSNISGFKPNLDLLQYASEQGFDTLLDAAALASTTRISLRTIQPDAMAISFYKMFGYPTGVGALIIKKAFLHELRKPWFSGGTVELVQVPGEIVTPTEEHHERFEDGTLNYLALPAITEGLNFLEPLMRLLPLRLSILIHHLHDTLSALRYPDTNSPVVRVLSCPPDTPPSSLEAAPARYGFVLSIVFLSSSGSTLPNSFIAYWASMLRISIRAGCVCNPGGAVALLQLEKEMAAIEPGVKLSDFQKAIGQEFGLVRISLGLGSSFQDVYRIIKFAEMIQDEKSRTKVWEAWKAGVPIGKD